MRYLPRTFPFKSNITGKDRWHGEPSLEAGKPGVGSHRRGKCLSIFLFVRESGESRKRWLAVILIKFFALELDYNSKPGHKSQTKQVSLRREAYDLAEERESSLERPTVFIELKMMTGEWIAEPLVKKQHPPCSNHRTSVWRSPTHRAPPAKLHRRHSQPVNPSTSENPYCRGFQTTIARGTTPFR